MHAKSAVFIRHIMVFARRRQRLCAFIVSIRIMRHQCKQVFIVRVAGPALEHKHIHAVCTIPCVTCSNILYGLAGYARHTPLWRLTCMLMPRAHTGRARCLSLGLMTLDCPPLFVQFTTKDCCNINYLWCSYTSAQIRCDLRADFDLIGRASAPAPCSQCRDEFVGCVFANLCTAEP